MADNTTLYNGDVVRSVQKTTPKSQVVVLDLGGSGTENVAGIAVGAGAVGTTVIRHTLASDDPAVVALQIMDDWDESDRAKVNPIAGQAGVAAGAGAVGATVQRVTLASDDPAVASLSVLDDWDETNRAAVNTIAGQVGVQGGAGTVTALTQRVCFATDANVVDTELPAAAALADAEANPTQPGVMAHGSLFNGTTWDRERNNHEVTVLTSAARTATTNSADLTNYNARGVIVTVDITAVPGVETVTIAIKYKDTLSGKYVALLTSAAQVATATVQLTVYPGATVAANVAASMALPRVWRVEVTHSASGSFTYSVSANYIL